MDKHLIKEKKFSRSLHDVEASSKFQPAEFEAQAMQKSSFGKLCKMVATKPNLFAEILNKHFYTKVPLTMTYPH